TPVPVLLSESLLSHSSCLSCLVSSCSGARVKSNLKKGSLSPAVADLILVGRQTCAAWNLLLIRKTKMEPTSSAIGLIVIVVLYISIGPSADHIRATSLRLLLRHI